MMRYCKHGGQLSQLCTVLCPLSSSFYWVLSLGRVPVLMFLQLKDVYFVIVNQGMSVVKKLKIKVLICFTCIITFYFNFKATYYFLQS